MAKLILNKLREFMETSDGGNAAYMPEPESGDDLYIYALENKGYTFHFSVRVKSEAVTEIEALRMQWLQDNRGFDRYVEPPVFVREAVDSRVEFVEDPDALCPFKYTCDGCGSEYMVDVTPKMDLLVDGYYVQRFIEEYCPECGESMIERVTFDQPGRYQVDYFREDVPPEDQVDLEKEVDISDYTWRHARR